MDKEELTIPRETGDKAERLRAALSKKQRIERAQSRQAPKARKAAA